MILTHMINSLNGEGGGDIPFLGDKTNHWNLSEDNPNYRIDDINGKQLTIFDNGGFVNGFLNVGYNHGIDTTVDIEINDYLEVIFNINESLVNSDTYHVRLINEESSDSWALMIWRGNYNYWTTYYQAWDTPFSTNDLFFNNKKLGIFIKDASHYDMYLDNNILFENIPLKLNYAPRWVIGCMTTWFSRDIVVECKEVTIYKNCTPKLN